MPDRAGHGLTKTVATIGPAYQLAAIFWRVVTSCHPTGQLVKPPVRLGPRRGSTQWRLSVEQAPISRAPRPSAPRVRVWNTAAGGWRKQRAEAMPDIARAGFSILAPAVRVRVRERGYRTRRLYPS
jgi:hypothetical protein